MNTESRPLVRGKDGNLVRRLSERLREAVVSGEFKAGDKLPSEAQLTSVHGVSRTVVREAIAALRSEGLVKARQGAGVFVVELAEPEPAPFKNIDYARISSVLEMLELRTAVESEAASLAALRRSPQQEETILTCLNAVLAATEHGQSSVDADFALHLAIADASNNPRFREFLVMIGNSVIPRHALGMTPEASADYLARLGNEHNQIVDAISAGDRDGAREAMRRHLEGSQARYRAMLRTS